MISLEQANFLAEAAANRCFRKFAKPPFPQSWLKKEFIEESNCWLFMKKENIQFLEDRKQYVDAAFVVSKKGAVITIADLGGNKLKLSEYLKRMSTYLDSRNE